MKVAGDLVEQQHRGKRGLRIVQEFLRGLRPQHRQIGREAAAQQVIRARGGGKPVARP